LSTRLKSVVLWRHDIGTVARSVLHLVKDGVPGTMCYLAKAQYVPASGALRNPTSLAGGPIPSYESPALPLDRLAQVYGDDAPAFLRRGVSLSGECCDYGGCLYQAASLRQGFSVDLQFISVFSIE
jgi:hypothetical protein